MTVLNTSLFQQSVSVTQNEVVDTEVFIDSVGQCKRVPMFYETAGNLEFSANSTDFFNSLMTVNVLETSISYWPRYVRHTGANGGKIHFYLI